MLIYFHIDELARDAVVASALQKEAEARGGRVIYGNRLMSYYILRYFNIFDAIILSSIAHYMDVFPDSKKLPDNVFILQTEAIGQATGTLRRLNAKYFGNDDLACTPWHLTVAGFLLWGHAHLNSFTEFHPEYLPKVRVVGHPRLSDSCKKLKVKPRSKKISVGFVSRFNLLSPHDGRTPLESVVGSMKFGKPAFPLYEGSPDKEAEDLFFTEVVDFRIMYQLIASLDPEKFEIFVRPHPRENRMNWIKLIKKYGLSAVVSPWDEPFGHWLQCIDILVTPPSTGLYDMFFHKKKVIVISDIVSARVNHILAQSDDKNQILEATCRPKTVEEALAVINSGEIVENKEIISKRMHEQVAVEIAHDSINNIINVIMELKPTTHSGATIKKHINSMLFMAISLIVSHLRWLKSKFIGRVEQGANFDMTIWRLRWIRMLVR